MASVNVDKFECQRIQWNDPDGTRRTIRLGKVDDRTAGRIKAKIERLVLAKQHGETDDELVRWLARVDDDLHRKLTHCGLVAARESGQLGPWIEKYLSERKDLKPASRIKLGQTREKLEAFFKPERAIRSITAAEASEWRASLTKAGLSVATIKIHAGNAKALFNEAKRRRLVLENPFDHLPSGPTAADTTRFVSAEETEKVLAACRDLRWRVLVGLARYAGLRVPSESHALTWDDVDFQHQRLRVHSVKTERHQGKGLRYVPITANLLPLLQAAHRVRTDSCVVTLKGNGYLHEGLRRIIRASGVEEWEDLYQTLRRSFEKELIHLGGFHDVTAAQWAGHSLDVSRRHYTQGVPEELYDRAAQFRTTAQATQAPTHDLSSELGEVVASWKSLSPELRAAVLSIVRSNRDQSYNGEIVEIAP